LQSLRNGANPKALGALISVLEGKDSKGRHIDDGSAAWQTARIKAATSILGDDVGQTRPTTGAVQVNLGINNTQVVTPGYVIRQPPRRSQQPAASDAGYAIARQPESDTVIDVTPSAED
jgi:hypothetical protein